MTMRLLVRKDVKLQGCRQRSPFPARKWEKMRDGTIEKGETKEISKDAEGTESIIKYAEAKYVSSNESLRD